MVDSVGSSGSTGNTSQTTQTTGTGSTTSTQGVSQGFNTNNSVSTSGSSTSGQSVTVSLSTPNATNQDTRDFFQRSFDAKLDGFRAAVQAFNRRFDAQDVDINDTQSLILMIKGMISDTQALISAESISQVMGNRLNAQSRRSSSAHEARQLKGDIRTRNQDIATKTTERDGKTSQIAAKETTKSQKEQELAVAQSTHSSSNDNSVRIAELQVEIQQLQTDILALTTETTSLNQQIQQMEASNAADAQRLAKTNKTLNSVTEEFVNVRSLLGKIKQRFDPAALETGEEGKEIVKELDQQAQTDQAREGRRLEKKKKLDKEFDREVRAGEEVRANPVAQPNSSPAAVLPLDIVDALQQLFAPENSEARERLERSSATTASVQPVATPSGEEGLAIALFSDVDELIEDEQANPAADTFYGDNLSFEGASPQVFAKRWVEAKLAEGDRTQDKKEEHLEEVQDNVQGHSQRVADAMDEFKDIPQLVADAVEKQQQAEAVISRNSRV